MEHLESSNLYEIDSFSGSDIFIKMHQKMPFQVNYIVTYSIMYLQHIYPMYIHACRATQTIRVKLSGDGTTVEKRMHCVTFSFTLLDEAHSVSLVNGVHPIAIFREPESYESLSLSLENVIQEVAELTSGIEVQGVHYNVRKY